MIWFCGTTSICVVDLTNLGAREIQNLLPQVDPRIPPIAMFSVARNKGKEILIGYKLGDETKIAYYEAGGDATHMDICERFSNCKLLSDCP